MKPYTIHHWITDYSNSAPRPTWQVFMGGIPQTKEHTSLADAVAALRQLLSPLHPDLRGKYAQRQWADGRDTWAVTLCDGTKDWAESLVTIL